MARSKLSLSPRDFRYVMVYSPARIASSQERQGGDSRAKIPLSRIESPPSNPINPRDEVGVRIPHADGRRGRWDLTDGMHARARSHDVQKFYQDGGVERDSRDSDKLKHDA